MVKSNEYVSVAEIKKMVKILRKNAVKDGGNFVHRIVCYLCMRPIRQDGAFGYDPEKGYYHTDCKYGEGVTATMGKNPTNNGKKKLVRKIVKKTLVKAKK
jgi:hypothetical protein